MAAASRPRSLHMTAAALPSPAAKPRLPTTRKVRFRCDMLKPMPEACLETVRCSRPTGYRTGACPTCAPTCPLTRTAAPSLLLLHQPADLCNKHSSCLELPATSSRLALLSTALRSTWADQSSSRNSPRTATSLPLARLPTATRTRRVKATGCKLTSLQNTPVTH